MWAATSKAYLPSFSLFVQGRRFAVAAAGARTARNHAAAERVGSPGGLCAGSCPPRHACLPGEAGTTCTCLPGSPAFRQQGCGRVGTRHCSLGCGLWAALWVLQAALRALDAAPSTLLPAAPPHPAACRPRWRRHSTGRAAPSSWHPAGSQRPRCHGTRRRCACPPQPCTKAAGAGGRNSRF